MSGRALVEFDGNSNIGWYDIGLDFLKIVDKPCAETGRGEGSQASSRGKGLGSGQACGRCEAGSPRSRRRC